MRLLHARHGDERHRPVQAPSRRPAKPRSASCSTATSAAAPATRTSSRPCRWAAGHGDGHASLTPPRQGDTTWVHPTSPSCRTSARRVRRKEDYRFLTGAGQYTDDIDLANQTLRRVRALAARARRHQVDRHRRGREDARRGRHLQRQGHRRQDGRAALRLADQQPRRHADEGAAAPDPGASARCATSATTSPWWWPRRWSRRKNAAEAVVVDYDVLPAVVSVRDAARSKRPGDARRGARQPVLQVDARRQGGGRRGLRQGGACHEARPGQQPADSQRDGAARGHRQLQPRRPRSTRSTCPTRTRTSSGC